MPGHSVCLCSTHPKPSPTTLRGLLAPIRQGRGDSADIVLKTEAGDTPKPGWAVGTHPPRAASKSKKIGVQHGVLGASGVGVRNLGNVEIAVFEQQKHGHRWGAMLSRAPAGGACHPVIGRLGANFGVISAVFRDTGCHDKRARPVIGTFGAKL